MGVRIVDPLAGQKRGAADYLGQLMQEGPTPTRGVAPSSDLDRYMQQQLGQYAKGALPAGVGQSTDYFSGILNQPTDITQLPEYQAILKSIGAETSDAVNRSQWRTQLRGMGTSGAQGKAVGKEIARGSDRMLASLAPLAEAERNRQGNAASMLANLASLTESMKQGKFGAVQQLSQQDYNRRQAKLNEIFNSQMIPYTVKAQLAQIIMGGNIDAIYEDKQSTWEAIAPLVGTIGGAIAAGPIGAGIGGGLAKLFGGGGGNHPQAVPTV